MNILNKSHIDSDIVVDKALDDISMQLVITQIEPLRRRKTVVVNRKFELCRKNTFTMTDYVSLYVISILNKFLNGTEFECPLSPRQFSIRSFTLNSKLIPLQLFYRQNSFIIVNGTFFGTVRKSPILVSNFLLNISIERTSA